MADNDTTPPVLPVITQDNTLTVPVLTAPPPPHAAFWRRYDYDYTDYVNDQDKRLKLAARQGFTVLVLMIEPNRYISWCKLNGCDPADRLSVERFQDHRAVIYPYDGSLWRLIQLQQVAVDLSMSCQDTNTAATLDVLDDQVSNLLATVIMQAAGRDGLLESAVDRGPQAQVNAAIFSRQLMTDVELHDGSWDDASPSQVQLLRASLILGQLWGGHLNVHVYGSGSQVYSCTYWLPWGQGKSVT